MDSLYKKCTKCGETKLLTEFHKDMYCVGSQGRRSGCKVCLKRSKENLYSKYPEKKQIQSRKRRERYKAIKEGTHFPKKKAPLSLEEIKEHKHKKWRTWDLQAKYGLTLEQYNLMLAIQQCKCAICNKPLDLGKNTCVDHDHATGRNRKILCRLCNMILGQTNEDVILLRSMIKYIEKYSHKAQ